MVTRLHRLRSALAGIEIFYTACEFWAAFAARALVSHLGSQAVDSLQQAATAFSEIGALRVTDTLNRALGDLSNGITMQHCRERLRALEDELSKTSEAVDQLIARYAENLNAEHGSSDRQAF